MKHTFTYWIYVQARGSQLAYELSDLKWSNDTLTQTGRVLIGERTLTLELPELNQAMPLVVASLEAKKQRIFAECQVDINQVDEQIQSLMALPAPTNTVEPMCDSCHDDITIDCHDCEQHQHAIEDGLLKVDA